MKNLDKLLQGNARFAAKMDHGLLRELADRGQKPLAAVVACSDARVPVELIFSQYELGRIFAIRVAGNVIADAGVRGSIEYAVEHLKVPELIIMGHTGCGAVQASLDKEDKGELGRLVKHMKLRSKDFTAAVSENVTRQVVAALEMEVVKSAVASRKLGVYGSIYDIRTGKVQVMSRNGLEIGHP